jgi:hypothetical protein
VDELEIDGLMRDILICLDDVLLAFVIDNGLKPAITYSSWHSFEFTYPLLDPCFNKSSALIDYIVGVEAQGHDRRYEQTLKASSKGLRSTTNGFEVGERVSVGIIRIKGRVGILFLHDGFGEVI